ncbi:hypothetical protein H310_08464 [Aphanomyces invadans]|uniref:Uncharacterized protein n=1 Tax=Aphanomyces invadans TaxID=157072 RepID=A0A024U076_9STRA|nr:hypothetical protein H310_08464 [Aphanomyces invadans]ETV98992.1 hypothetical protein H310_08464 [Aphanomyces invadans]|eukprot:XP_008872420.1 hypothetical protein H310_08464 [Aphanomyces invadans]
MRIVEMENACDLHTYCLKREPWCFHKVSFLIDRLHYKNHVNCSSDYRIDNFPFLHDLRTVAYEIVKATPKSVTRQAGFMGADRLLLFTKHYIKSVNQRRVKRVQHEMQLAGLKREVWKSMNVLIQRMQVVMLEEIEAPCTTSNPCVFCL